MPISQCPRCELKFSSVNEMRWHLREDHPNERAVESTPLTVPVTRRGGTLTDPDPQDPQDPAPTPPGRRAALWWRRWLRGDRS